MYRHHIFFIHSFNNGHLCVRVCAHACVRAQSCPTLCDPVNCSLRGSSMGFSRQEYQIGLPFSTPGALPYPGIESPALAGRFFTTAQLLPYFSYCK